MVTLSFAAQVDEWTKQTQERLEAVFKASAQNVIEDIIQGTPRDTGFLVASLTATTSGLPQISRNARPTRGQTYQPQSYAMVINGARLGQTISAGFVASYAPYVEYGAQGRPARGMVRKAAQRWPQHIQNAIKEVRNG